MARLSARAQDKIAIRGLLEEIARYRTALEQIWDCEEDSACPNCKLIARDALMYKPLEDMKDE